MPFAYVNSKSRRLFTRKADRQVAVVGVTWKRWDEMPATLAVLKDAGETSQQDVLEWANSRLGKKLRPSARRTGHNQELQRRRAQHHTG